MENSLVEYRCHLYGEGHDGAAMALADCATDEQARDAALDLLCDCENALHAEVWHSRRLVYRWTKQRFH